MTSLAAHLPLASGGSFLITPHVGLMVWTLVVFLISFFVLRKWVYPVIGAALDARANRINESIDAAEKTRHDADQLLVLHDRKVTYAVGCHQGHAFVHGVRRGYTHQSTGHNLLDLSVLRRPPHQDALARVISLGDYAHECAVGNDQQCSGSLVGHCFHGFIDGLIGGNRPDGVALVF